MRGTSRKREAFRSPAAIGLFALACAVLSMPWLWGSVTIPYDAKSQFYPQLVFLARSLAAGQSPFWTPNVFAGWPQIADPQSLIFSPLYFSLRCSIQRPASWPATLSCSCCCSSAAWACCFISATAAGMSAARWSRRSAFAFGGSAASRIQHVGQVESLVFLPLALLAACRGRWSAVLAGPAPPRACSPP